MNAATLFPESELEALSRIDDRRLKAQLAECDIPGLDFVADFVTLDEELMLMHAADSGTWSTQWKRRTQWYGARYGVEAAEDAAKREIPGWAGVIRERLVFSGVFTSLPPQMGINEYLPGQGIAAHVDHMEGTVVSLSLGSGCMMEFRELSGSAMRDLYLPRRSIVVLNDAARYQWTHGIAPRLRDVVDGRVLTRTRRISLTFRSVTPR